MRCGIISKRQRHRIRALFRSISLTVVLFGFSIYKILSLWSIPPSSRGIINASDDAPRRLSSKETISAHNCNDIEKANPPWLGAFYFLGVLYTFVAIAIVCDELFVPTLEEMSSDRHLNLSMDVAGATLMAAGGSAPEFFTSLLGTFVTEDELGIGTVVGSAVFNVLFVIAMCALFSKEVLKLTWWPLARDSVCYCVGLVTLGLFVGVISVGKIELWEAIVLFVMYIGYVIIMMYNQKLYKIITGKELVINGTADFGEVEGTAADNPDDARNVEGQPAGTRVAPVVPGPGGLERDPPSNRSNLSSVASGFSSRRGLISDPSNRSIASAATSNASNSSLPWPGTFRASILKLLRDPNSWAETVGVGIVAQIAGDVENVFNQVDIDGNGEIDKEELAQLFVKLECNASSLELDEVMGELDHDKDGMINEADFTVWYIRSEERIRKEVKTIFDYIDSNHSGTIDREKVIILLERVDPSVTDADIDEAMQIMYKTGSRDEITFKEFSIWYMHSMLYGRQKKKVEDALGEEEGGIWESLKPPPPERSSCMAYARYICLLPIVTVLAFTVPDVRTPGNRKYCYLSFILSIIWIGGFSYLMVMWTEIVGNTIGIPPVIMGLTLLAAGTSVPDLLTSVIVARMGEGDMALSSSIGSNIFDILVGLPVPWIIYTAWPTKTDTITIGSKNVWISIFVLLGMLLFIVIVIHCQGWKLTKTLGGMMLVFYVAFLAQAILIELPFESCVAETFGTRIL